MKIILCLIHQIIVGWYDKLIEHLKFRRGNIDWQLHRNYLGLHYMK